MSSLTFWEWVLVVALGPAVLYVYINMIFKAAAKGIIDALRTPPSQPPRRGL